MGCCFGSFIIFAVHILQGLFVIPVDTKAESTWSEKLSFHLVSLYHFMISFDGGRRLISFFIHFMISFDGGRLLISSYTWYLCIMHYDPVWFTCTYDFSIQVGATELWLSGHERFHATHRAELTTSLETYWRTTSSPKSFSGSWMLNLQQPLKSWWWTRQFMRTRIATICQGFGSGCED